ncbi:MAG: DegV family protein, partial [Clostridia bacterium]|nr:DegV family protein [Clostridia bacterium]
TIGNMLGIKPVINLDDGELKKDSMVRNVKKTFAEKIDKALETMPASEYDYTLISFDAVQSTLDYICNYADSKLDGKDLNKGIIPINVCAHCGPGTIGLVVSKKINGKPLASFVK